MARLTAEEREGELFVWCRWVRVITRLIQRYRVTGKTADRPRSGIPRITGGIAPNQAIAGSEFEVHRKIIRSECNEDCDWCIYVTVGGERNVLFNDARNTFYLRLYGVRHG